jgi:hypothetical protein
LLNKRRHGPLVLGLGLFLYLSASAAPTEGGGRQPREDLRESLKLIRNGGRLHQAIYGLRARSTEVEQELKALVANDQVTFKERWFAVMALTKLQGSDALAQLVQWTEHNEWYVRLASLKAIGYLPVKKEAYPVATVQARLKDKAILVRDGALEVLEKWCLPETKSAVLALLDDKDNFRKNQSLFIRKRAVDSLAKCDFGGQDVTSRLVRIFDERNLYGIHEATHEALTKLTQTKASFIGDGSKLKAAWAKKLAARSPGSTSVP